MTVLGTILGVGAAPEATVAAERASQYAALFAIVASLLGGFMLAVVLIGYLRRRRVARHERDAAQRRLARAADEGVPPDAWAEAGRREAPYSGSRQASGEQGRDADDRE